MADERNATEEPTPRRLREARDRGEIARSMDFTSAGAFAGACLVLGATDWTTKLTQVMKVGVEAAVVANTDPGSLLERALLDVAWLTAPVMLASFTLALLVGGLQAGGLWTLKTLLPQGQRLSPAVGAKRVLSGEMLALVAKSVAKLAVIIVIAGITLVPHFSEVMRLGGSPPDIAVAFIGQLGERLLIRVALVYVLLGVASYFWQRRAFLRKLRMTRDEVKREHRESEGDPRHRAERQRLHRDLLRHRMIEAVRTADCVIVNPDHLAVALRFDANEMNAPEVVAKGERLVAEQIKDVARQFGVPIYRDVPLARALIDLELGDEIPEALYEIVAEVLRALSETR